MCIRDRINPDLDLALGLRVGAYDITIALIGTANEPRLEFRSSPELSDGDIVAVLLFGKTADELDEGQTGVMAERAAQMALAYGSVALQERLAKELGVDVLSIAPSTGNSEKSSLTVGKYLNPRVMVRYEQVLSEQSTFFVHLDYSLAASQEWRLHSQLSEGNASGVEIKWQRDW
jgi:translocation and assembly module TamB